MTTTAAWRLDDKVQEGARIGFYEVEQRLGSGGLAVVYRARDVKLDRRVALKFLGDTYAADAGIRERFLAEARAMARLHHSSIVGVHAFDELEERPYFAMELVEGGTLADRLGPDLNLNEVLDIGLQVLEALDHAWKNLQLVHRDIKPANILITRDGRAKLADFGLAKVLAAGVKSTLTQTGTVMGTPFYLSPEQIRGQDLDHRSDFYSLGATLYHCVTGIAPFDGEAAMAIVVKHLEESPVPPRERRPGLDAAIDRLILRLLAKKRDERPADHAALRAELIECLGGAVPSRGGMNSAPRVTLKKLPLADTLVQATPPSLPLTEDVKPPPPDAASLRPWRWVALVATMVLVAALVSFRMHHRRQGPRERSSTTVTEHRVSRSPSAPPESPRAAVRRGEPAHGPMPSLLPEAPTSEELRKESNGYYVSRTPEGVLLVDFQNRLLMPTEAQRKAVLALMAGPEGSIRLARGRIRFLLHVLDQYLGYLPKLGEGSVPRVRLMRQIQQLVQTLEARLQNPWSIPASGHQRRHIVERLAGLQGGDLSSVTGMRLNLEELARVMSGAGGGRDLLLGESELGGLVPLPGGA